MPGIHLGGDGPLGRDGGRAPGRPRHGGRAPAAACRAAWPPRGRLGGGAAGRAAGPGCAAD
eukprot:4726814-Alexandrium_andersonii.AAC.1